MEDKAHSKWPGWISASILGGFFAGHVLLIAYGFLNGFDEFVKQIVNMNFVALISGVSAVLGYWLGSSASGETTKNMLNQTIQK